MTLRSRSSAVLFSVVGFVVALGSTGGCGREGGKATGSTCPTGSTLTYETFGKAFLQTNCLGCHASKESPALTSVDAVRANKDDIDRLAAAGPNATNTEMPQGATVSDAERKQLGEWLACGAP